MNANLRLLALGAATALFALPAAHAAGDTAQAAARAAGDTPQARYQQDRAACTSGQSTQDQRLCLREAGAALNDAKQGKLENYGDFERNTMARCDNLPMDDRDACRASMQGRGSTEGSVKEGAILREYRETMPVTEGSTEPGAPGRYEPTPPSPAEPMR